MNTEEMRYSMTWFIGIRLSEVSASKKPCFSRISSYKSPARDHARLREHLDWLFKYSTRSVVSGFEKYGSIDGTVDRGHIIRRHFI